MDNRIYFVREDEFFSIGVIVWKSPLKPITKVGAKHFQVRALFHQQRCERQHASFYVACAIVVNGDRVHRETVQRWAVKRSRNIRHKFEVCSKNFSKGDKMDLKQLRAILAGALSELRQKLSLSDCNPVEYSYMIDDRVLANEMTEHCRNELERFVDRNRSSLIYPKEFNSLKNHLNQHFPQEAKKVLSVIEATKTREHLAALSLSTEGATGEDLFVSIVNTHGELLMVEAWKFCALIEEHAQPQRMGTLGRKKDYREPNDPFSFNDNKFGDVLAQFIPATSTLHVVCQNSQDASIADKATFIIDIDYALCIYITLKQLREDRERFNRLKEKADMSVPSDLFDNLHLSS